MAAHILVLEDEQPQREFLKSVLSEGGYVVTEADTLAALRSCLRNNAPDVLLLDLHLPDGDGLSAVPEVRKTWPATRIVILTGHGSVQAAEEAFKMDDVFLVTKPVDVDMLKTVLELALTQPRRASE